MKALKGNKIIFNKVFQGMDFLINYNKNKQEEHAADQNLLVSLLMM